MIDIATVWTRIERVLRQHAPEVQATLAPPASAEQIAAIERAIGYPLPADLGASLLIHNGQIDSTSCLHFCGFWQLITDATIVGEWRATTEIGEGLDRDAGTFDPNRLWINAHWWKRSCIPFAGTGGGDMLCVDMDPSLGAAVGRVVVFVHDNPMDEDNAPSFAAWLYNVAKCLEASRFHRKNYGAFTVELDRWF